MDKNIAYKTYRLAEYRIVEDLSGHLWWETHFGFGSVKVGPCSIRGDILFIKPAHGEQEGFLKGEFLDQLHRLPKWNKTKYYCSSYRIYECKSDIKPLSERLDRRSDDRAVIAHETSIRRVPAESADRLEQQETAAEVSYKLDRYEITQKSNGQLYWRSHRGFDGIKGGKCYLNGNTLFIGPPETETVGSTKREFTQRLVRLPRWQRTKYYCPSYAIYSSKTGVLCRDIGTQNKLERTETETDTGHKRAPGRAAISSLPRTPRADRASNFKDLFASLELSAVRISKLLSVFFRIASKFYATAIDTWSRIRK
jgi:hypothetical protein